MHKIFFVDKLMVNQSDWFTSFLVTAAGVGLAITLQEVINFYNRKNRTSKFISFLIKEAEENLSIIEDIVKTCDGTKDKIQVDKTGFGFPSALVLLGITSRFKTNAYEAIKQGEHYLTLPPENSLKIFSSYSRLADIGLYVSMMINTWNASEAEAVRENISKDIIDQERKNQIVAIVEATKIITLEAKEGLINLIKKLKNNI